MKRRQMRRKIEDSHDFQKQEYGPGDFLNLK